MRSKNILKLDTVHDLDLDVFTEECNQKLRKYSQEGRLVGIQPVTTLDGGFGAFITYWDKQPEKTEKTEDIIPGTP